MDENINMSLVGEEFISNLDCLLEYVFMPNFQGERTLAPFLFWHIDEILNCYFNDNSEWGGRYKIISLEFPFKKDYNNQSDNVDILLVNTDKNFLVLLEIKMVPDVRKNDEEQFKKYLNLKDKISNSEKKAAILIDDLEYLSKNAPNNTRQKYSNLYTHTREARKDLIQIDKVKIVYLVPDSYASKMNFNPDEIITFSKLPHNILGSGSHMWKQCIKPALEYISNRFNNKYRPIDKEMKIETVDRLQNTDSELKTIYNKIYNNHKNNTLKPINVYVSKRSRISPNYMLEYPNHTYKTFYYSGTPFTRFSVFNKNNLMNPISFEELQRIVLA